MTKENKPQKNLYDTTFKVFFKDNKKNFIDLYEALSGNRLSEDDITPYGLDSDTVKKPLNNDVSYLTSDNRLIIMVEHQSTPSENMPAREFLYYAQLINEWSKDNNKILSGGSKIDFPLPEFYVAYNGKRAFNKDSLSFNNEFISIKCKFLDINLDNLKRIYKNMDKNNALYGYAYFTHHYREKFASLKKEGIETVEASKTAFEYAQNKCINEGISAEIMKGRGMMLSVDFLTRDEEIALVNREEGIEQGIERSIRGLIQNTQMEHHDIAAALEVGVRDVKLVYEKMISELSLEEKLKFAVDSTKKPVYSLRK
jgi:hypothetical protein